MSAFRVEQVERGIVHLVMDDPARKVNVIDEAAIESLERALAEVEAANGLIGLVLRSGKPGSFIAGADVNAIGSMTDQEAVRALVRRAHAAFGRLAKLPFPTVAAIDGVCLGGGTEIALACDSRIASEEPRTQIGLPEVLLGIFPGFGGTTRMPRLVGLSSALDLVLSGRTLDARRAAKAGLVARAVPAAWLVEQAHKRLAELRALPAGRRRDAWHAKGLMPWLLDGTPMGRSIVFSQARSMTLRRTGGHYPAPLAAMRVMAHGLGKPVETGLALEADEVSALVVGQVCKNLVRIFQLSEEAKKGEVVPGVAKPEPVQLLALAGAGVMGGGIAELASRNGATVRMRDIKTDALSHALKTARGIMEGRLKRRAGRDAGRQRDAQLGRILPTLELNGVGRAEFAIEAVVEDLDIKRRVLAELEVRLPDHAILATNTSSLSVTELAQGLKRPERFCGLHFFNPVHRMPLVEVVRGAATADATIVSAVAFARRLGKTPVVTADRPGFVVNRILMPYLREAMHLLEEGYPLEAIDRSMKRFGMPMGPFEVLDEVGLDVASKVAVVLGKAFPDRMTPAPALDTLVAAGRLGRKTGAGFYRHRGRKREVDRRLVELLGRTRERKPHSLDALADRMVLAMVNESARCLEEKVVERAGEVDVAMIFGTGFPPFRGGPLRHADALGIQRVESRLTALMAERGERFKPAAILTRLVASGGTFTG